MKTQASGSGSGSGGRAGTDRLESTSATTSAAGGDAATGSNRGAGNGSGSSTGATAGSISETATSTAQKRSISAPAVLSRLASTTATACSDMSRLDQVEVLRLIDVLCIYVLSVSASFMDHRSCFTL